MNIIEKEIAKREALIAAREEKLAEADELAATAAEIRAEYEPLDIDTLIAEIEELKTYLAKDDEGLIAGATGVE